MGRLSTAAPFVDFGDSDRTALRLDCGLPTFTSVSLTVIVALAMGSSLDSSSGVSQQ